MRAVLKNAIYMIKSDGTVAGIGKDLIGTTAGTIHRLDNPKIYSIPGEKIVQISAPIFYVPAQFNDSTGNLTHVGGTTLSNVLSAISLSIENNQKNIINSYTMVLTDKGNVYFLKLLTNKLNPSYIKIRSIASHNNDSAHLIGFDGISVFRLDHYTWTIQDIGVKSTIAKTARYGYNLTSGTKYFNPISETLVTNYYELINQFIVVWASLTGNGDLLDHQNSSVSPSNNYPWNVVIRQSYATSNMKKFIYAYYDDYMVILFKNGTVKVTGDNTYGQLGIGSVSNSSQAIYPSSVTNVKNIVVAKTGDVIKNVNPTIPTNTMKIDTFTRSYFDIGKTVTLCLKNDGTWVGWGYDPENIFLPA